MYECMDVERGWKCRNVCGQIVADWRRKEAVDKKRNKKGIKILGGEGEREECLRELERKGERGKKKEKREKEMMSK